MKKKTRIGTPPTQKIFFSFLAWITIFLVTAPLPAQAHQPHDEIWGMGISPNFSQDGTMITLVHAGALSIPLISYDRGLSFNRIVRGMDHRGKLADVAFSPHFATDRTILIISPTDGVYRSTDAGFTFQKINPGMATRQWLKIVSASASADSVITLAAAANGKFTPGIAPPIQHRLNVRA